jgi:hypothetical protein
VRAPLQQGQGQALSLVQSFEIAKANRDWVQNFFLDGFHYFPRSASITLGFCIGEAWLSKRK